MQRKKDKQKDGFMMKIMVFGITHKNSNIALREKVAFSKSKLLLAYDLLKASEFIEEAIIISTCNRSEIFAVVQDLDLAELKFKQFYIDFFRLEASELEGSYSYKSERAAIEYLFEVCCGLDSLVLGEDQILGQVKEAYSTAIEQKASGKVLNKLFLEAVTSAKEIKTQTGISENPLSISSIAVKKIQQQLMGIEGKRIMVIGFGKMSRIAIENLIDKEAEEIYICNRSRTALEDLLTDNKKLKYISFEERYLYINQVDAIISATSAPHYVLFHDEFIKVFNKNLEDSSRRLCIIDIALPRDVDPLIDNIKGVSLFHIDQLKEIADENMTYRKKCIEDIGANIKTAVDNYIHWYNCLPLHPRIKAIQGYSKGLTDQELEKLFKRLGHVEEKDKKIIEVVVRSLIKKMWRQPILQLKNAGNLGKGEEFASFIDEFFGFHNKASQ